MRPARFGGTVHPPLAKAVKEVPPGRPPLVKAHWVAPVAVLAKLMVVPAAAGAVPLVAAPAMVKAGKGVIAKLAPVGQD